MSVPLVFKEGISEGQAKAYAEKATAYINKGLGEPANQRRWQELNQPPPCARGGSWRPESAQPQFSRACSSAIYCLVPCKALPASLLALPSSFCPPIPPLLPPAPAAYGNRLATGREPMLSGTVVGIAYLVGRLAGIFSLVGLAYGAALAAFTLPKVSQLWPLGPGPVQATPAPAAIAAAGVGGKLILLWLWGLRPHLRQLICCCQNDVQRAVSGAAV